MKLDLLHAAAGGPYAKRARLPLAAAGALLAALGLALALTPAARQYGVQRLLMLLVLAPVLEETVFRAGLQEALLRHWRGQPWLANGVTALAFGLAHAALRADAAALAAALPALLIGALYQRSGRLRLCIALHALLNGAWLLWSMLDIALPGYR